jgi:hypothetical protein
MDRRSFVQFGGAGFVGLFAGCLDSSRRESPGVVSTTKSDCSVDSGTDLETILPPAPDGFERSVDPTTSDVYLDDYEASARVAATYSDGDDGLHEDYTVEILRFREDANADLILRNKLLNVEFGPPDLAVAALLGRTGFLAHGPRRQIASSLLAGSPSLSADCLERQKITPSKTSTPADDSLDGPNVGGGNSSDLNISSESGYRAPGE